MSGLARNSIRALALTASLGIACVVAAQGLGAFGDATGPAAPTITDAPLRPTIATSASFGFRGVAARFECSMDSAGYRPCPSPVTYRNLKRTSHTFRVRGRDGAGNAGGAAAYQWKIVAPPKTPPSNVVPRPVMTTVPLRPWLSRTATFAWDRRGARASQCSLDGRRWRSCAAPRTYRRLALGTHVFRVRGVSGSRHSSDNRFTWRITTAAPPLSPVLTGRPSASMTSTEAVFTFTVLDGLAYECKLDGSGWQQCSNPAIYVGLGAGEHTFCVRSVRANGVAGPPACTSWLVRDPTQPDPPPGAFTIAGDLGGTLAPGLGGTLAVTITNPLSLDLTVTDLVVTVAAGSSNPGCDGPDNLAVTQSNMAGGSVPVVVPAGGSVALPAQGATAPVLTMLDLASNQDACKGATFTLSYAATGTG